ncbi:DNA-3-methyladenine glycosylase family protein [Chitinimonas lacunae]|uniref:DNA-3-methyladenine glycosylase II n=1 Tax=Chitinimonas lacunae TaxID=1963018 RepID=A0ABV8MKE4_9NEIS
MDAASWAAASAKLAADDPVMARLIAAHPTVWPAPNDDPFSVLCHAVVGQQLSLKAAEAIWQRLLGGLGGIAPAPLLAAEEETLRALGLSRRKVEYLRDLSQRWLDGRLDPSRWAVLDDEALIAELSAVRGIGRWTAEMFLLFHLQRPDVFPVDDLGLQKAAARHYGNGELFDRAELRRLGERWAPWRSLATWFLWRSLEPVAVQY